MDLTRSPRFQLILAVAFLAMMAGAVADLVLDRPEAWLSLHVAFEVLLALLSLGLAVTLYRGWREASREVVELQHTLEERREERDRWRGSAQRLLEGLGVAIDDQFSEWELTPAEREVALHLLKGYSHKRIARLTDRSERTVRQHAVEVYRKSGLGGRAELAAFFLEDIPARRHEGDEDTKETMDTKGV